MNNPMTFPLRVWVNISLFTINPREIFHPSKWNKGYVSRETLSSANTCSRGQMEGRQEKWSPPLTHDQFEVTRPSSSPGAAGEGREPFLGHSFPASAQVRMHTRPWTLRRLPASIALTSRLLWVSSLFKNRPYTFGLQAVGEQEVRAGKKKKSRVTHPSLVFVFLFYPVLDDFERETQPGNVNLQRLVFYLWVWVYRVT